MEIPGGSGEETASSFDLDGDELRTLGREFLELALEILEDERRNPILPAISGTELDQLLSEPLPELPGEASQVLEQFRTSILAYRRRNGHPGFWAYVCSSADPVGVLADLLASSMNQIVTSWRSAPTATAVERRVVAWLDEMVGFQGTGHGLLLGGGSAANTEAVICAIESGLRKHGLDSWQRSRFTVYASREIHVSIRKAIRLLGIPAPNLRLLGIDEKRRLRCHELEEAVVRDRREGQIPCLVCSSAGTANSGAVDPLSEIEDLCQRFELWHHVDGSYGALAALTPEYGEMRSALCRVDSLSLDPHKWLFSPLDCGCLLLRDPEASRTAFSEHSEYTEVSQKAPLESFAFFDHGLEMSRRFRALKLWFQLKIRGVDAYRQAIRRNIELRRQLDERVRQELDLEWLASDLSISCFRYRPASEKNEDRINRTNRTILNELIRRSDYLISPTTLDGRFCLRVCIINFRTSRSEIEGFLSQVLELGEALG